MRWSLICALVVMVVAPPLASSQTSYTLVCRGGGKMHFAYQPFSELSKQGQVWIKFEPGSQPAGAHSENVGALQAGQCSWRDRVLAADEPRTIAVLNVSSFSVEWENNKLMKIVQVTSLAGFPFITDLLNSSKILMLDLYNNGKGQFVITGGPFE